MPKCPYCNEILDVASKYCPKCEMLLPRTGKKQASAKRGLGKGAAKKPSPPPPSPIPLRVIIVGGAVVGVVLVIGFLALSMRSGVRQTTASNPTPAASTKATPSQPSPWTPQPIPVAATPRQAVEAAIKNLMSCPSFRWVQTTTTMQADGALKAYFWDGEKHAEQSTLHRWGDLNKPDGDYFQFTEDAGRKSGWHNGMNNSGSVPLEKLKESRVIFDLILARMMEERTAPQLSVETELKGVRELRREGDNLVAELEPTDASTEGSHPTGLRFVIQGDVLTGIERQFVQIKEKEGKRSEEAGVLHQEFYDLGNANQPLPSTPNAFEDNAPESYRVKFTTTQGDFTIAVPTDWAPVAAKRFRELISAGYYGDGKFDPAEFDHEKITRIRFGRAVERESLPAWNSRRLPDDPFKRSAKPWTVYFHQPHQTENARTGKLTISCDGTMPGWRNTPFGEVVEGRDVLQRIIDPNPLPTLQEIFRIDVAGVQPSAIAMSDDGKFVATGLAKPKPGVRIWDVATGREIEQWVEETKSEHGVHGVTFSPDGSTLLVQVDHLRYALHRRGSPLPSVAIGPVGPIEPCFLGGGALAIKDDQGADAAGAPIKLPFTVSRDVLLLTPSPDGQKVALLRLAFDPAKGESSYELQVVDLKSGDVDHRTPVTSQGDSRVPRDHTLRWVSGEDKIVLAATRGPVNIWNFKTGEVTWRQLPIGNEGGFAAVVSSNGEFVFFITRNGLQLWRIASVTPMFTLANGGGAIKVLPDGRVLILTYLYPSLVPVPGIIVRELRGLDAYLENAQKPPPMDSILSAKLSSR